MKLVLITAVVVGLSAPAFAQGTSGTNQSVGQTNQPVTQAVAQSTTVAVAKTSYDDHRNWMASGYIGTNFGTGRNSNAGLEAIENLDNHNSTSFNWGGQVAYLGRGVIGGEFLADFSPGNGSIDNLLFADAPSLNSYMFNAIAAAPFGHIRSFDPYVSGGIGRVSLRSTIFTVDPTRAPNIDALTTESANAGGFGWDLGFGAMVWSEKNWGFRGDVRYFRTTTNDNDILDLDNIGDGKVFARAELSGISFWKANAGLSFRW